jgi:predicted peptidase
VKRTSAPRASNPATTSSVEAIGTVWSSSPLHGAGERGSDLDSVAAVGIARLAEDGHEFPFVLASPQCPEASQWVPEVTTLAGLLDDVIAEYRIDESRIYRRAARHRAVARRFGL